MERQVGTTGGGDRGGDSVGATGGGRQGGQQGGDREGDREAAPPKTCKTHPERGPGGVQRGLRVWVVVRQHALEGRDGEVDHCA